MESNFAKRQLEKYGWVEGQGLGKDGSGMAQPIKIKMKKDNSGVGLSPGEEFTDHWWRDVFNRAASNISIHNGEEEVVIESDRKEEDSNKQPLGFRGFVQSTAAHDADEKNRPLPQSLARNSDEELWKACGGRTAHKAARHGFKLSGKLQRIDAQDKLPSNEPCSTPYQSFDSDKVCCSGIRKRTGTCIDGESCEPVNISGVEDTMTGSKRSKRAQLIEYGGGHKERNLRSQARKQGRKNNGVHKHRLASRCVKHKPV